MEVETWLAGGGWAGESSAFSEGKPCRLAEASSVRKQWLWKGGAPAFFQSNSGNASSKF